MAIQTAKINIAFWFWRNLADGQMPFYESPQLARHQTYLAPVGKSRLRLWL